MSKSWLALGVALAVSAAGCNETAQNAGSTTSNSSTSGTGSTSTGTSTSTGASAGASASAKATSEAPSGARLHKLPSGLQYEDLVVGSGKMAEPGMNVAIQYTGWLTDGTKFDSSLDRGQPLRFQLASGQMIQGFDEGVKGMRIGGKRKLTVPYDLGYGEEGRPPQIPPKATLVFDVELIDVQ